MAKGRTRYKTTYRLHLGQWLIRLDKSQAQLARAVGVEPPTISELVNHPNEKFASSELALAISDFLGITVNELYQAPPPANAMNLSPATIARLAQIIKDEGGKY